MAISPQLTAINLELIEKKGYGFDILSDPGNQVAKQWGLAWDLPKDLQEVYGGFGIDLASSNGDSSWSLPMPARYVVSKDGVIRSAHVNPDYTRRPEPTDTLAALAKLA